MSLEMRVPALLMLPSVFGILGLLLQFCLFFIFFKSLVEVKGYADKTGCSRHTDWDGVDTSDVVIGIVLTHQMLYVMIKQTVMCAPLSDSGVADNGIFFYTLLDGRLWLLTLQRVSDSIYCFVMSQASGRRDHGWI